MQQKDIIGIDEAGRGPLAGPVSVGVACVSSDFDWGQIPGVNDSKKLTEKNREAIFLRAKKLQKEGKLQFAVSMVSAKVIDKIGIVPAINLAMKRALRRVVQNSSIYRTKKSKTGSDTLRDMTQCLVQLDGGLKAPEEYVWQETIVKGDSKEKVIGLASIMAKVTRDRYMKRIAKKTAFAAYDLAIHKGYGTKKHRECIAQHGLSTEHRTSYCKNIKVL